MDFADFTGYPWFLNVGANSKDAGTNLSFGQYFLPNCVKMKEIRPTTRTPIPWVTTWICQCLFKYLVLNCSFSWKHRWQFLSLVHKIPSVCLFISLWLNNCLSVYFTAILIVSMSLNVQICGVQGLESVIQPDTYSFAVSFNQLTENTGCSSESQIELTLMSKI